MGVSDELAFQEALPARGLDEKPGPRHRAAGIRPVEPFVSNMLQPLDNAVKGAQSTGGVVMYFAEGVS